MVWEYALQEHRQAYLCRSWLCANDLLTCRGFRAIRADKTDRWGQSGLSPRSATRSTRRRKRSGGRGRGGVPVDTAARSGTGISLSTQKSAPSALLGGETDWNSQVSQTWHSATVTVRTGSSDTTTPPTCRQSRTPADWFDDQSRSRPLSGPPVAFRSLRALPCRSIPHVRRTLGRRLDEWRWAQDCGLGIRGERPRGPRRLLRRPLANHDRTPVDILAASVTAIPDGLRIVAVAGPPPARSYGRIDDELADDDGAVVVEDVDCVVEVMVTVAVAAAT